MIIEVDTESPTPPYEQIRRQVALMAASGVLPVGTRLPSIRQLAQDLGLAAGTVGRAYRELEADGVVTSRVRHGTTIAQAPPLRAADTRDRLTEAAHAYAVAAHSLGVNAERAVDELGRQLRKLAAG